MDWQDAVIQSPERTAVRTTAAGDTIRRYHDGSALRLAAGWCKSVPWNELEGFTDWLPLRPERQADE